MGDAEVTSSSSFSAKKPKNENDKDVDTEAKPKIDETQSNIESNSGDPSNHNAVSSVEDEITTTGPDSTMAGTSEDGGTLDEESEIVKQEEKEEEVELRVIFNKEPLQIKIALNKTVGDLKTKIEEVTSVSPSLQKVLVKGMPKDESTLSSLGLTKGSKVLVIATKLEDILTMSKPQTVDKEKEEAKKKAEQADWCSLPQHRKIIDKGVPPDAMVGILNERDSLPPCPIHGMVSSKGHKVRLTFKLESDELWIGTKERTEKVPMQSIRNVVSQPITGFEHYHIMAFQLGPTEASRLYIYWVPAQYVQAIKEVLSP